MKKKENPQKEIQRKKITYERRDQRKKKVKPLKERGRESSPKEILSLCVKKDI